MITEKSTIRCESVFNDEHTHRYLWKQVWNKDKPLVGVVTLNPCQSDNLVMDTTTSLVVNNIARLEEYGGVAIVNLFSQLTTKLNFKWNSDEDLNGPENDHFIQKTADECAAVILAWGKGAATNKRIAARAEQVAEALKPHQEKLFQISDGTRIGLHPLTPSIRSQWLLEPFRFPTKEELPQKEETQKEAAETEETAPEEAVEEV